MNKAKALALIDQQRRFWRRWQDPNLAIAQRAERVFFRVAVVYLIIAPVFIGIASVPKFHLFYAVAGTFLFFGVFLLWRSRRFTQVLRVLSEAETEGHETP